MKELLEYVELIPVFKPVVSQALEEIRLYDEEWLTIRSFLIKNIVDTKSDIFNGLVSKGLTREEALAITISSTQEFKQGLNKNRGVK